MIKEKFKNLLSTINSKINSIENALNTKANKTDVENTYSKKVVGITEEYSTNSSPTTLTYIGKYVTVPANSAYCIRFRAYYNNASVKEVAVSQDNTTDLNFGLIDYWNNNSGIKYTHYPSVQAVGYTTRETTFYFWAAWNGSNKNTAQIYGFYIPS